MKLKTPLILKTLLAFTAVFTIAGCDSPSGIESAVLDPNYKSEWHVGEVNFDSFKFIVTYTDGIVEEKPVTTDNIAKEDLYKFYEVGEWKIKFNYNGYYTNASFNIIENEFSDEIVLKDKTVAYDGDVHTLEVEGPIPEGTNIYYPFGNSFTESSSVPWSVKCILTKTGYKPKELNGKLYITQAPYNPQALSEIKFEDKEVLYDGSDKKIVAENVPSDITVSYLIDGKPGNSAKTAGVHRVVAQFSSPNRNYLPIESKIAYLTIKKISYNYSKIKFEDQTFEYDGTEHSISVSGMDTLPESVSVSYENNGQVDQGVYEVIAKFSGDPNYEEIPPMTAYMTIVPKKIRGEFVFGVQVEKYDGTEKNFNFSHKLPSDIKIDPVYYDEKGNKVSYIQGGVEKNVPIDAGIYKVLFEISGFKIDNYEILDFPENGGIMIIEPKNVDFSNVSYVRNTEILYDGSEHVYEGISNVPVGFKPVISYEDSFGNVIEGPITETGVYKVKINYSCEDENEKMSNYSINGLTSTVPQIIIYENVDFSGMTYESETIPYTGSFVEYTGVKNFNDHDGKFSYKCHYYLNGIEIKEPVEPGTYSITIEIITNSGVDINAYKLSGLPIGKPSLTILPKE